MGVGGWGGTGKHPASTSAFNPTQARLILKPLSVLKLTFSTLTQDTMQSEIQIGLSMFFYIYVSQMHCIFNLRTKPPILEIVKLVDLHQIM